MRSIHTVIPFTAAFLLASCAAGTDTTVVVEHPPLEGVTLLDLGDEGPSVGDIRVVSLSGNTTSGESVHADFELLTVEHTDASELRNVRGTFVFGDGADQLVLVGTSTYSADGATIGKGSSITRPVVGGSGRYAGATGWVETTHQSDDSWTHTFHLHLP